MLFFEHPIPLRITFFVHAISYHFIWCYSHDPSWVSKKATCQSFQGYSQQFVRFPPDSCYSFRLLRRERNYAKYILIVKYFAHEQSKMTRYWLKSWSLDPEFTALIAGPQHLLKGCKLFIWGFRKPCRATLKGLYADHTIHSTRKISVTRQFGLINH